MGTAVLAIRVVLAVVFATAGIGKLLDIQGSRRAVRDFGVPDGPARIAGVLLPLAELATAVALVFRPSAQWGGALALLLLLLFIGGIANALRHGIAPDCHCFGQIHSAPAGRGTLVRNGILGAMAAVVLVAGTGPALDAWVRARSAAELVAVAVGAAAVVVAMFALQLWTEVRKLRVDIRAAERMAAGAPPGLPVGVLAPRFELESMDGGRVSLEGLLERGPSALLVFASPGCGSCVELFPNVRRWQQTLSERLTIAILSTGDLENNRTLRDRYGLEQLLVQEKSEMFEAYRIRGTPSAVLVKPDGKIASLPAESVFAIEPMVRLVLRDQASPAVENDHATVEGSIA